MYGSRHTIKGKEKNFSVEMKRYFLACGKTDQNRIVNYIYEFDECFFCLFVLSYQINGRNIENYMSRMPTLICNFSRNTQTREHLRERLSDRLVRLKSISVRVSERTWQREEQRDKRNNKYNRTIEQRIYC